MKGRRPLWRAQRASNGYSLFVSFSRCLLLTAFQTLVAA